MRARLAAWCVAVARAAMRCADWLAPGVPQAPVAGPGRFAVHVTYADGSAAVLYRGDHGATAQRTYAQQATYANRRVVLTDGDRVRGDSRPEER